jgi:uncharacterized membrane protein
MTASRLQHLADLASEAARYYRRTHPAWARTIAAAAVIARLAAAHEDQAEERHQTELGTAMANSHE